MKEVCFIYLFIILLSRSLFYLTFYFATKGHSAKPNLFIRNRGLCQSGQVVQESRRFAHRV
jgi:hypothetical protein